VTHSVPERKPVWDTVSAPHRLKLGLRALSTDEHWLEVDEDLARDLAEKRSLLRDNLGARRDRDSRRSQCFAPRRRWLQGYLGENRLAALSQVRVLPGEPRSKRAQTANHPRPGFRS
jgi:hypothetical protein